MTVQIQVKNVSKIFGSKPKSAIPLIKKRVIQGRNFKEDQSYSRCL